MSEKPTLATPAQSLPFPSTPFPQESDEKVVGQVRSITGINPKNELIALDRLDPNPFQPRGIFDDAGLRELADSIQEHGLLHPILAAGCGSDGRHLIICGERRVRAVRLLGWTDIPTLNFGPVTQNNLIELALTENLVRVDLSPLVSFQP